MTIEEAKSCICTIKILQKLAYNIHGVMDVVDADNCKKIIKTLEKEPKTDWIPVSERLPEKNGEYLITGRQGAVNKRRYHDGHWYGNWGVLAWMPLPEPYNAESEE